MNGKPWSKEDDAMLRELVGTMTAESIGKILGRTQRAVWKRVEKLELNGRLHGERHWNAKLSNLQAAMIGALHDAGFTTNEIHGALSRPLEVSLQTTYEICSGRTRRGAEQNKPLSEKSA